MKRIRPAFLALSAICLAAAARAEGNPGLVAKVRAGELREARASWWGFDANDATKCLQAAIDSGVARLIVDKMPNAWSITPVKCVSNQEIVFEAGAKVSAKRAAFQGRNDTLFTLAGVSNVTIRGSGAEIRMFRNDYAAAPYDITATGSRNTFAILGSANVALDGLVLLDSGGTGVLIDGARGKGPPSTDVRVSNCKIEKYAHRGVYVGGAKGVALEKLSIREADGSRPRSGISFASDNAAHVLQEIVVRDCAVEGCAGHGFEVAVGGNRDEKAPPVTLLFEGCSVRGCDIGLYYMGASDQRKYPRGRIAFDRCEFAKTRRHAVKLVQKPLASIRMEFSDCRFDECCAKTPAEPDVALAASRHEDPPADGILFSGVDIRQGGAKRSWISLASGNWMAADVKDISGKVRVFTQSAKKDIALDTFWRKANFPPKSKGETPPRVAFKPDAAALTVVDLAKGGAVPLAPLKARGTVRYAFCVEKARTVHLQAQYIAVNRRRSATPISIAPYGGGKPVAELPLPDFYENGDGGELVFDVPAGGFYSMEVNGGGNIFMLTKADVPIALDVSGGAQLCQGAECALFFPPPRGRPFAVFVSGPPAFEICQGNGTAALRGEGLDGWSRYLGSSWGMKDLWSVRFSKPRHGPFGDFQVDLLGMPPFFFLSDKKFWRVR